MDLAEFDLAARVPLSQLLSDLGELRKGHKTVLLAIQSQSSESADKIEAKLGPLATKLAKSIERLAEKAASCEKNYELAANYLCESPKESSEKLESGCSASGAPCATPSARSLRSATRRSPMKNRKSSSPSLCFRPASPPPCFPLLAGTSFSSLFSASGSPKVFHLSLFFIALLLVLKTEEKK